MLRISSSKLGWKAPLVPTTGHRSSHNRLSNVFPRSESLVLTLAEAEQRNQALLERLAMLERLSDPVAMNAAEKHRLTLVD